VSVDAMTGLKPVIAVVGMTREAKILGAAPVVIGGGCAATLAATLQDELSRGVAGVISFGLCGALDPTLKVGDVVVGESVADADDGFPADAAWAQRIVAALPGARLGSFARSEQVVGSLEEKAELRRRTGAAAVDLESYVVARLARWFGAPFAILRAVSDTADRTLPHAARVGLGADGRPAIGPVLASLRSNPWQIGSLIRTALEAEDAFHALERARQALGPRLAGP
jgi:hopanoid-associated phosphorylase